MPSQSEHLEKAEGNTRFANAIRPQTPVSSGWILTVLFYSALHYVEAFNAKHNQHFHEHPSLSQDIHRNPQLSAIYEDYRELSDFSWNARYRPNNYGITEVTEAKESHAAVEQHIRGLLGIT